MELASAVFNGILLLLVALGVRDVFFVYESNRCSMTYMFEYPEYQNIKLPKKVSRLYPAYELYLYGEGAYAEENKNFTLTGIPVLFVPGNAGSYKQARSIGSIALRKAENIDSGYHFNVFSVNLNEELVALYGGSLQRQTKFVHECIKAILRRYKGQDFSPQSVAIIGHSMGGLVAKALLTLKNFKPELINLIITQATPHVAPVLPADHYLTDFYALVNNYWILNAYELRNITTLSVAGGYRDYQIRSGLTFLPGSNLHNSALSVVTSAVPRTWASTDHLSIVWCKELLLATTRALFDLIDGDTKQITKDPNKRMSVLNHHFVRHPAKLFESRYETAITLSGSSMWIHIGASKWTYSVINLDILAKVSQAAHHTSRNLMKHFLHFHSWNKERCIVIFTVKARFCLQIDDLSWKTELLPSAKVVTLKLEDFLTSSHFILHVPTTNGSKFSMDCEFLTEDSRTVQIPVTHALSFGISSSHIKLNSTGLLHIVQLQDFSQIYQAFNIYIERNCTKCKGRKPNIYRLHVPWSHEDLIRSSEEFPVTISAKLHTARPQNDSSMVTLSLYTTEDCHYEVTIYTSFLQILGQVIRFHGPSLPVYIISNLLLAYGAQLSSLLVNGHCIEFDSSLDAAAKPYKVDPIVNICRFLLGYSWFKNAWDGLLLPELNAVQLDSLGLLFPMASLFLFMFGTGIAYWSGIFFKSTLRSLSSLWIVLKWPADFPKDERRLITPRRYAVTLLLAFVCLWTCGTFSLLLVFLRYLLKVIELYSVVRRNANTLKEVPKYAPDTEETKDLSNENTTKTSDSSADISVIGQQTLSISSLPSNLNITSAADSLKMHITIMNLLLWVILLSLPSFIYWLKNLRYTMQLYPDPNRFVTLILIFTLEILMNSSTSSIKSSKWLKTAARLQLPFSIVIVAFAPLHLYRVSYFVTLSLLLHVLCCFI
ncbi:GPI inositol-deacylase isoform X2 [Ascaphus truei]|uniref:GPI inositol-deacylase isoform X2 n=1 Tax=Ascaphus truei TaxID=8439 RepID=UPI003F59EC03